MRDDLETYDPSAKGRYGDSGDIDTDDPSTDGIGMSVLKLWRTWIVFFVAAGLAVFSFRHPEMMGDGYFWEQFFGAIAIIAVLYAARELNDTHRFWGY